MEPNIVILEKGKELYQSPNVEIIEVKVEKGFAASPSPVGSGGSSTGDWGSGTW